MTCPYCWESHTVVVDLTQPDQTYIEDCEVCCHPMQIRAMSEDGEVTSLEVERAQ